MQRNDSDKAVVQTLLVWVLVMVLVFLFRAERGWLYAAIGFAVIGVVALPLGRVFHRGWMALADLLARFMPAILLGAVFYVVLTPVALLMRLTRGSVLRLHRNDEMLQRTPKSYHPDSFTKPW